MNQQDELSLGAEFPAATHEQWRKAVDKVLAGKDSDLSPADLERRFVRQLVSSTYNGFDIQPLYSAISPRAYESNGLPGLAPFVRGADLIERSLKGWGVSQSVYLDATTGSEGSIALEQLEGGATSLFLRGSASSSLEPYAVSLDELDETLRGVFLNLISLELDSTLTNDSARAVLDLYSRREVAASDTHLTLGRDPIGSSASSSAVNRAQDLTDALTLAHSVASDLHHVRTFVADGTRFHNAGASDADEVAFATALGLEYLREMVASGMNIRSALNQIAFRFSATSEQFMTIAKLRAARRVWARIAEELGEIEAGAQVQHAVSSFAMLTIYDPWVNMLRNTTACFAAGVGGATTITVESHDLILTAQGGSDLGRRMARHTHRLLLDETHAGHVIDPAGGSAFVESLTDELARAAWARVQELEARGSFSASLDDGTVPNMIEATVAARNARLATRLDTIVGVNDFPNVADAPGSFRVPQATGVLPRRRYAEAFEELRNRTQAHRPTVTLVRLGAPSAYTARATFARAFFETAGCTTNEIDASTTTTVDALQALIGASTFVCLCSSDAVYGEEASTVIERLRDAGVSRLYAAVRPGELGESLLAAGASELIHAGCNVLDILTRALDQAGVK